MGWVATDKMMIRFHLRRRRRRSLPWPLMVVWGWLVLTVPGTYAQDETSRPGEDAPEARARAPFRIDGDTLRARPHGRGARSTVLQNDYLDVLYAWAEAATSVPDESGEARLVAAVDGVSDFQQSTLERFNRPDLFAYLRDHPQVALDVGGPESVPGGDPFVETLAFQGFGCLTQVEAHHLDLLSELEPQAAFALGELHRQLFRRQTTRPWRLWLVAHNRRRLEVAAHRHPLDSAAATSDRDLLFLAYADALRSTGFSRHGGQAVRVLEWVLEDSPEHHTARYWAGFLAEKHDLYRRATTHFQLWVNGFVAPPPSPTELAEGRLRLAVNYLRLGKGKLAEAALRQVARDDDLPTNEQWLRRVAYQEWTHHLMGRGGDQLKKILQEGLDRFPGDSTLQLLAAYQRQGRDWQAGLDAVLALEDSAARESMAPRRRYEMGRDAGLSENRSRWVDRRRIWGAALLRGIDRQRALYKEGEPRPLFQSCDRRLVDP